MMKTTGNDGISHVRARAVVFQLAAEKKLSTRQEQTMTTDSTVKSIFPLIISIRTFDVYFIRKLHLDLHAVSDVNHH